MDRQGVDAWLDGYRRAWEQADPPAVLGLFTADASYRSHPLRPAHTGHDGVGAYWARATADQQDVRVHFGDPIVDGDRVAVEWWATMTADGDPTTLAGCLLLTFAPDVHYRSEPFRAPHPGRDGVLAFTRRAYATEADQDPRFGTPFLTFTPDGLVGTARDYWFLEPGRHKPFEGWGR
jgi:hypothetical protein